MDIKNANNTSKKLYTTPKLTTYGSLTQLTQQGSGGMGGMGSSLLDLLDVNGPNMYDDLLPPRR